MLYEDKDYRVTLTFKCENCGGAEFVNPDMMKKVGPKKPVIIEPDFIAFALGEGERVPLTNLKLSHKCAPGVIGPMKFIVAEIREIKNET